MRVPLFLPLSRAEELARDVFSPLTERWRRLASQGPGKQGAARCERPGFLPAPAPDLELRKLATWRCQWHRQETLQPKPAPSSQRWRKGQPSRTEPTQTSLLPAANGPGITWAHPHPASPPVRAEVASYGHCSSPSKRLSWTEKCKDAQMSSMQSMTFCALAVCEKYLHPRVSTVFPL